MPFRPFRSGASGLLVLTLACSGTDSSSPPKVDSASSSTSRPNVVVFTLDTTRADRIGAYGATFGATPHLDSLAQKGIRFDNAYAVTPLTIPSHTSMFTGLLPPHHGVRDNGDLFLGEGATTLAERFKEGGYTTMASVGAYVTTRRWGFGQGFDAYFDEVKNKAVATNSEWEMERSGDRVTDDALSWLNSHADKPFFTWIHYFDAHHPYRPPAEFASRFPGRPYVGELAFMDAQVGRIVEALSKNGTLENTWIIALADHGEGLGDHEEPLHGMLLYDSTVHIPFLVRPPGGLAQGRSVAQPVSGVDLTPTLLGVAGLPIPAGLDGRDLSPLFQRDAPGKVADVPVYIESEYARRHYGWAGQKAVVEKGWKLHAIEKPELYPVGDHQELSNQASQQAPTVTGLQSSLGSLLKSMKGPAAGISEEVGTGSDVTEKLQALGYMNTVVAVDEGAHLPDPRENLPVLKQVQEAQLAFRDGRTEEGVKKLQAVIQRVPELVDPRTALAQGLLKLQRPGDALQVLEDGIRRSATQKLASAPLVTLQGISLLRMGKKAEATRAFESALNIDPRQPQAWASLVELTAESGDMARAKLLATQSLQTGSDIPQARAVLGAALAAEGNLEEAEQQLKTALQQRPDIQYARYHLGLLYIKQNKPEEAEEQLLEEVRLHPDILLARATLAQMYGRVKAYDKQQEQIEESLKARPKDVDLWHAKALALFNQKLWAEAGQAVEGCLALDDNHPACHMMKANVLARLGRRDEAQVEADLAKELAKERGSIRGVR